MSLQLTDINAFEDVFKIAQELPTEERTLFRALTGMEYDAQEFMVTLAEIAGGSEHHYLIMDGETAVATGGFLPQRPGVFRTWFMAPSASWPKYGRELTDVCRDAISGLFDRGLAHRVETVTLADRAEARAWYERIGLTFESTLRGYGANGEDAVMYVAVRNEKVH